jgi:putative thioredoxin
MPIDVATDSFEQLVIEASKSRPVLVDFWAPWCGPCKQLTPVLEELETESEGRLQLVKADVEAHPELAQAFGIQGIPALRLFQDGKIVAKAQGVSSKSELEDWLKRSLGEEDVEQLAAAKAAEDAGDDAAAEAAYRAALEAKPGHDEAVVGLAGVLERTGQLEEAAELVETLDGAVAARIRLERAAEGGPTLDEARAAAESGKQADLHALGRAEALAGHHEKAIELLLDLIARDKSWNDEAARKTLLEVFQLAGNDSELVDAARRRLAMLLY